ncbi:hypothetical protein F0562_025299 [Nyssa sinensis]|uniref:Integrase catalytic domain-containing protein n=1 Tax=Nyssa sinensis TaxID=561372 RepID=A0A5J5BFD5_9ASTE|nr:hypothetical protein F0562_025299 [Nyssa sinensis]
MDFIEGLPPSKGKSTLLVVVDWLSKYAHFIPIAHPYTAVSVAQVLFEKIFSLAYHPQTDGQTEVVNRTIEMYLRCLTRDHPKDWATWIPWVEFSYNIAYHSSIKTSPFEFLYGRPPPNLLSYTASTTKVDAVDIALKNRDVFLKQVRQCLAQAQERMKRVYDQGHHEERFEVGDRVYLKLQAYRQHSVQFRKHAKLSPRFYGPFRVDQKIGEVSYKLDLPKWSHIHPVFHVSLLKQ